MGHFETLSTSNNLLYVGGTSLHSLAIAWLTLSVLTSAVIAADILIGRRQKMMVMNFVWPITALYFGPFGFWAYWRLGRVSHHGDAKMKPLWSNVLVGATHCGAGCTVGDFIGEWLVFLGGFSLAGSTLWADYLVDLIFAYLAGIAFQYFAIAPMRNIHGWKGIKEAIKADTLSLLAFEVGMFAWMGFSQKMLFQPPLTPDDPVYWFMMQIAMAIGFATSLPANWILIRAGIKEAM